MTEANANPDAPTEWKQLYSSAKQEYGLASMTPTEWNNLIERMETNDTLFSVYHKNYYRRTDTGIKPCTGGCKSSMLCSLRKSHHSNNLCKHAKKEEFTPNPNKKVQKKKKAEIFEEISEKVNFSQMGKLKWNRMKSIERSMKESGISKIRKFSQKEIMTIRDVLKKVDVSKITKFDSDKCPI